MCVHVCLCSWRRAVLLQKVFAHDDSTGVAHGFLRGVLPDEMLGPTPSVTSPRFVMPARRSDMRVPDAGVVAQLVQDIRPHDAMAEATVGRGELKRQRRV